MSASAQNRWILLNILRISGILIACVGLVIWRKGIGGYQDELVGKIIFMIGVIESLMLPALLRRKWRGETRAKDDIGQ